ncbi:MAG TPA: RdgB/HAM1 family non-canonical purine NTP pyrophosphatase [Candidatus Subteraquimicrobiales bacterium]
MSVSFHLIATSAKLEKMIKIVIASQNEGKIKEIKEILNLSQAELLDFHNFRSFPSYAEDKESFRENAVDKAKNLSKWAGFPAIADDSGLEVDVLGGAPGVRSARFAGPSASYQENNQKLLKELKGVPFSERTARFKCVAVYIDLEGYLLITEGILEGHIAENPKGAKGFGYDPLFIPKGFKKTLAEIAPEEKNRISHRGQAFRKLKDQLGKHLA